MNISEIAIAAKIVLGRISARVNTLISNMPQYIGEATEEWLDEHIVEGYAVDDTLAIEGAAADAKKTGDEITTIGDEEKTLKSAISGFDVGKFRISQTINKYMNGVTHIIDTGSGNTLITTVDILYANTDIELDCPSGYQYLVAFYTTNVWATGNWISNTSWITGKYVVPKGSYYAVQFRRVNSDAFSGEADKNILIYNGDYQTNNQIGYLDEQQNIISFRESQKINKGINGITFLLENKTGNDRITTTEIQYAEHDVTLNCPSGYRYTIEYFGSKTWTTENHISSVGWQYSKYVVPSGSYYAVQFAKTDASAFSGENDKVLLTYEIVCYAEAVNYINEISKIIPFRETQKINKVVNGITFLLGDTTGNSVITNDKIIYADRNIDIDCSTDYKYVLHFFTSDVWTTANHLYSTTWLSGKYTIQKGAYFVTQFAKSDNSAFANGEKDKNKLKYSDVAENDTTLYHVIVTGQSLAVGAEGNPALTTVTPLEYIGKAYQFIGGARPIDGMENDTGVEEINVLDKCLDSFSSLREQTHMLTLGQDEDQRHSYQGETICSGLGYHFARITGKKVLVSNHGFGGKSYNQLKKGTTAYNNSIRAVYHAKDLCDRLGWKYVVYAIAVVHGEADSYVSQTAEQYKGYLHEWQTDYDTDIKAITGQTETVQLFSSQTAASSSYNLPYSQVPNGVFLASVEYEDIHYVCPQYAYPLTYASVHMNKNGYRYLGEYFGVIMGRTFNRSVDIALYPIKSELSGTTITLTFNLIGDLSYDGTNVSAVSDGNWGFELVNDQNEAEITGVSIQNNKIAISLSGAPSNDAEISYAYKVLDDEMGKIGKEQGVRGNLRTTWAIESMFVSGTVLPHWCAIFSVPVNWSAT